MTEILQNEMGSVEKAMRSMYVNFLHKSAFFL